MSQSRPSWYTLTLIAITIPFAAALSSCANGSNDCVQPTAVVLATSPFPPRNDVSMKNLPSMVSASAGSGRERRRSSCARTCGRRKPSGGNRGSPSRSRLPSNYNSNKASNSRAGSRPNFNKVSSKLKATFDTRPKSPVSNQSSKPSEDFRPNAPSNPKAPSNSNGSSRVLGTPGSNAEGSSRASASSGSSASAGSNSDQEEFLSAHNSFRATHGARSLEWSGDLAAKAQQWADRCKFEHSKGQLGRLGENLFMSAGRAFRPAEAVKAWTDEERDYNPANPVFSHFTQVVWKGTTQIGCATQLCDGLFSPNFGKASLVVCEYFPAGNVAGQFGQNVQKNV